MTDIDEKGSSILDDGEAWKPMIITADDLCRKEFPEPRWAVPGIVPEGTTLLCGKPKMGKSWMALGFGIAVASGGVALGSLKVKTRDVLYLSLEDNERRLKKRIQKILPDGNIPARLHLTTEWPKVGEGSALISDTGYGRTRMPAW